ncbi:conserved hypothetical protein [Coccidioides posadasii str. Silveira]|uniref:Uncharacterized protein n=1 Tax=Coccidioides posadasii (strain RMSCC 757 / Silveira) TaxID=443226 RepID=E9DH13_COCPS|nr:conserved hypothetical protein [Coccidioides posadasii str. Silveira]
MPENIKEEIDQVLLVVVTWLMLRSVANESSVEPQTEDAMWINHNSMTTTQPKTQKSTHNDEHPSKLDEIAWLVTELKETITQQDQTVEALKTCCKELKADQKELIRQNASLKDKIATLKTQLYKSDQQTWASIASANRTNSQLPISLPATTGPITTKDKWNDLPLCIHISAALTSETIDNEESLTRYLPAEEVKTQITDTLQKNTSTEEVKIIGVGTTKTGYIIWFQNEISKDTASKNEKWKLNVKFFYTQLEDKFEDLNSSMQEELE